jgi:hypothetical protein
MRANGPSLFLCKYLSFTTAAAFRENCSFSKKNKSNDPREDQC